MAAGDAATVFLETTLGTRLVVSFPARATTVADLKRQVTAEHAACFPDARPIAVASLQVKLDGSWFQLTDSMAVGAAFEWIKGPWRLLAEVHELQSHRLARNRKDAKCGTDDAEPNAGHPVISENSSQYMLPCAAPSRGGGSFVSGDGISDTPQMNQKDEPQEDVEHASAQCKDGIIDLAAGDSDTPEMSQQDKPQECVEHDSGQSRDGITMPEEISDIDLAAGDSDSPLPNQEDKPQGCIEHASDQLGDGVTRPQESSEFDLAEGGSDAPPVNQQDKSHEGVEHASGQSEDRITVLQESSELGVAANKGNGSVGVQRKDIITEPKGKKRLREEDKTNESSIANCGDNLSSRATSTLNAALSEKKSSVTEQAKSNSIPSPYHSEGHLKGLGENPSGGQKDTWTSGVHNSESSNNGSDVPPCVPLLERDKTADKEVKTYRGDKKEPCIAEGTGESSLKRTDSLHRVESMKEDIKRPASNSHHLDKGKNEGATSTVSKEQGPCFRRSHRRIVVRKVPISRAMKMYPVRC